MTSRKLIPTLLFTASLGASCAAQSAEPGNYERLPGTDKLFTESPEEITEINTPATVGRLGTATRLHNQTAINAPGSGGCTDIGISAGGQDRVGSDTCRVVTTIDENGFYDIRQVCD